MEGALILANQKAAFAQPMFWSVSFAIPGILSHRCLSQQNSERRVSLIDILKYLYPGKESLANTFKWLNREKN